MAMYHYLFYFALPWLHLRRSIREGKTTPIDLMWAITLPWMRATGKKLYSAMCVDVIWTLESMSAPLRDLWNLHRTLSLNGHPGRNMAQDKGNEHMNNVIKTGLGTNVTRENIDPFILQMLGATSVASGMKDIMKYGGNDGDDGAAPQITRPEYIGVNQSDVDFIVNLLKDRLGTTHIELFSLSSRNTLEQAGTGIANPARAVQESTGDLRGYLTSHFTRR